MFAFPGMLVSAAEKAGIPCPENPESYDKTEYKRFFIFEIMQLGRSFPYAGVHWNNAKVIADIPDEKLETITPKELKEMGFE